MPVTVAEAVPGTARALQPGKPLDLAVEQPTALDVLAAGIKEHSPLANLGPPQQTPPADPNFDWYARAKQSPLFAAMPEPFYAAQSEAEWQQIEAAVGEQLQRQKILADAGLWGVASAMIGGMLSPTILIPAGGLGLGAKALEGALLATTAVGIDEAVLQATQPARAPETSLYAVTGAALLGAILGQASATLSRRAMNRALADALEEPVQAEALAITPTGVRSVGAAEAGPVRRVDPGAPAPAFGFRVGKWSVNLDKPFWQMFPSTRVLSQPVSKTARWIQAQLTTGGLKTEAHLRGEVTAPLGEAEMIARSAWGKYYEAYRAYNEAYARFRADPSQAPHGTKKIFAERVGLALRSGTKSPDPYVDEAAKAWRESVFLPFYERAKAAGLPGFRDIPREEALKYLTRKLRKNLVFAEEERFREVLRYAFSDSIQQVLEEQARKTLNRSARLRDQRQLLLNGDFFKAAALSLAGGDTKALKLDVPPKLQELLQKLGSDRPQLSPEEARLAETAMNLAHVALSLPKRGASAAVIARRVQATEVITEALYEAQGLRRLIAQGDYLGAADDIDALLKRLRPKVKGFRAKTGLEGAAKSTIRALERLRKALRDFDQEKVHRALDDLTEGPAAKELDRLARKLAEATPEEIAARVDKVTEELRREIEDRLQKIQDEAIEGLTKAGLEITDPEAFAKAREQFFDDPSVLFRAIDVPQMADRIAESTFNKLMFHDTGSLPFLEVALRSPLHRRTLLIDEMKEWPNGYRYADFLENDIEKVARDYIRVVGPELALQEIFGTTNPLGKGSPLREAIHAEFRQAREEARKIKDVTKAHRKIKKLVRLEEQVLRDLSTEIDRLRHLRGVPEDPNGFLFRLGRQILNMNVLTKMGAVVPSSIPDLARVQMKGLFTGPLRVPFKTFVENSTLALKGAEEVKRAGAGIDSVLHGRATAMFDVFDEFEAKTRVERMLDWATQHFGKVSLFDYWNSWVKQDAGVFGAMMFRKGMEDLLAGRANRATRATLAEYGFDEDFARRVLSYIREYQGKELQDIPTPSDWLKAAEQLKKSEDPALRAKGKQIEADVQRYRASLTKFTDDAIVTPGIDRPLWTDMNIFARMFAQFRSFTLDSTKRVMLAAMQDMRVGQAGPVLAGMIYAFGLGILAYLTRAALLGGPTWERVKQEVNSGRWDRLMVEGFARSGLFGVLEEMRTMAERVPALRPYATFGTEQYTQRRGPFTPAEIAFGPWFGLINQAWRVGSRIGSGQFGPKTANEALRLIPGNNIIGISHAFRALEEALQ